MQRAQFIHNDEYLKLSGVNPETPYSRQSISEAMKNPRYKWVSFAVVVKQGLMLFGCLAELYDWRSCQTGEYQIAIQHSMSSGNSRYGTWRQRHAAM